MALIFFRSFSIAARLGLNLNSTCAFLLQLEIPDLKGLVMVREIAWGFVFKTEVSLAAFVCKSMVIIWLRWTYFLFEVRFRRVLRLVVDFRQLQKQRLLCVFGTLFGFVSKFALRFKVDNNREVNF